ncbi:MAG: pseudouridine synthase [Actinomycetaceae bacterium]|nr:pseudouridine synthase [Actinomycetaceae bacterium]
MNNSKDIFKDEATSPQRLHKVLAHAGVASRRACEDLITQGRVRVNGETVTMLGTRVNPDKDTIHVDGLRVLLDDTRKTFAVNKPVGVLSTMSDPQGRPNLGDLARVIGQRVYHIGRLDEDTSGLILMTNDGELAHRIMHPGYELTKTYVATVAGRMKPSVAKHLVEEGVELDDGLAKADDVVVKSVHQGRSLVQMSLHMGKNRIVRRMFDAVGHRVLQLARITVGPIHLGDLQHGEFRELSDSELKKLYHALDL